MDDAASRSNADTETNESSSAPAAAMPAPTEDVEKKKPKGEALVIPKASVKRIMKIDHDVNQVANDAVILVAKATELFMEKLTRDAHDIAAANGRKLIKYEDLADARELDTTLAFMEAILPPRPLEERENPPIKPLHPLKTTSQPTQQSPNPSAQQQEPVEQQQQKELPPASIPDGPLPQIPLVPTIAAADQPQAPPPSDPMEQ